MLSYPKGLHYYEIADKQVSKRFKITQPTRIERLFHLSTEFVVVRSRGGVMWRLFGLNLLGCVECVNRSRSVDALIMEALLG